MHWLVFLLAVLVFSAGFIFLRIIPSLGNFSSLSLNAIELLSNHLASDAEKQAGIRRLVLALSNNFLQLVIRVSLLLFLTVLPFFIFDELALVSLDESFAFASRIDVLVGTTVVFLFAAFAIKKSRAGSEEGVQGFSAEENYTELQRVIHNIAFGSMTLNKSMVTLENKRYSERWQGIDAEKPIFICALPRAGTTALLRALARFSTTASNTYRDMPFILSPVLWNRISGPFQKTSMESERAHADGILVNEDSPEAFDEVLWLRAYPQKYDDKKIYLWNKADPKFSDYFREYSRKIIYARGKSQLSSPRYLSKCNANIARIPALVEMFPEASILVPVREPVEHAISLMRQHGNFLERHQRGSFTRKYMADIGHFEFGDLHRLIDFPDELGLLNELTPESPDYWLAYWIVSYSYLLEESGFSFVDYKDLCVNSESSLRRIVEHLNLEFSEVELKNAAAFFKETSSRNEGVEFSTELKQKALELYKRLLEKTI